MNHVQLVIMRQSIKLSDIEAQVLNVLNLLMPPKENPAITIVAVKMPGNPGFACNGTTWRRDDKRNWDSDDYDGN